MVGAIIGYCFLALAVVLALVLCLHTVVGVRAAKGGFQLWVRVLFVRINLLPAKPRPPKKERPAKPKKKKAGAEEKPAKPKRKRTFGEVYALAKRAAAAGKVAAKIIFRHLHIKAVQLVLPVHAEDAADTATRCGQAQAGIGAVRALLAGRLDVRFKRLEILPDFVGQNGDAFLFSCKIAISPGIIVAAGMAGLWTFLFHGRRSRARRKQIRAAMKRRKQAARKAQQTGKAA